MHWVAYSRHTDIFQTDIVQLLLESGVDPAFVKTVNLQMVSDPKIKEMLLFYRAQKEVENSNLKEVEELLGQDLSPNTIFPIDYHKTFPNGVQVMLTSKSGAHPLLKTVSVSLNKF